MKNSEKPLFICFYVLIVFLAGAGCFDDGVTTPEGTPPVISNLVVSPVGATVGQNGGEVTVTVTVDFEDPEGDLFSVLIGDPEGNFIEIPLSSVSDDTVGKVAASFPLVTAEVGGFILLVEVSDNAGNRSNQLTADFLVQ